MHGLVPPGYYSIIPSLLLSKLEPGDGRYVNTIQRIANRDSNSILVYILVSTPSSEFLFSP